MSIQNDAPYARAAAPPPNPAALEGRLAKWELLPNMRVGTFSHFRDNDQRAFATFDGSCLCHHGECAGTIRAWRSHEAQRAVVRWSTCDCVDTKGLTRTVKPERLPPKPSSYFAVLQAGDADRLVCKPELGVEALATPLRCEAGPVFLASDGRFFCGHGNEFVVKALPTARKGAARAAVPGTDTPTSIKKQQRTIRRRYQTKGSACTCQLTLPNRTTFPELPFVTDAPPTRD